MTSGQLTGTEALRWQKPWNTARKVDGLEISIGLEIN